MRLTNSLKRALNASLDIWQQLLSFTQASIVTNNPVVPTILTWQGLQMDQLWEWHRHSVTRSNAVFEASKLRVFNRSRQRYWSGFLLCLMTPRLDKCQLHLSENLCLSLTQQDKDQTDWAIQVPEKVFSYKCIILIGPNTKLPFRPTFLCWVK